MYVVYIVIGLVGLYLGAEWLVKGGVRLAVLAKIPTLIIGLTLVAFATSSPEMVVSITGAMNGNSSICVGNILGSNICNILLILGLSAVISPIHAASQVIRVDTPIMIGCTLVFAALLYGLDTFSWPVGLLLVAGLIVYTISEIYLARKQAQCSEDAVQQPRTSEDQNKASNLHWGPALFWVVLGVGVLIFASHLLVSGSLELAHRFHLSEAIIALTIIALGTSLPELATSVVAAAKKQSDIAVGNVVGSSIFNILGIMGVCALIAPVSDVSFSKVDIAVMLGSAIILLPMLRSGLRISRLEGAILLLIYIAYTTYLICNISVPN